MAAATVRLASLMLLLVQLVVGALRMAWGASVGTQSTDEWGSSTSSANRWQDLNAMPPTTSHRCVPVPTGMDLCHGIGYNLMRLPNMLHHETVAEAQNQASHWNMLKRTNCHSELPIFLCSMYAPVCVRDFPDKEIRPCRSLCEAVKKDCLPVMRRYGFKWPEMANCTQFPGSEDPMCIRNQEPKSKNCKACKMNADITMESIVSNYCMYNLVFKARIKKVIKGQNRRVTFKRSRRRFRGVFFRTEWKGMEPKDKTEIKFGKLESSESCKCPWLDGTIKKRDKFLVMGDYNRITKEVNIKFIHKWQHVGAFKAGIRKIRKSLRGRIADICSNNIIPTKKDIMVGRPSGRPSGRSSGRSSGRLSGRPSGRSSGRVSRTGGRRNGRRNGRRGNGKKKRRQRNGGRRRDRTRGGRRRGNGRSRRRNRDRSRSSDRSSGSGRSRGTGRSSRKRLSSNLQRSRRRQNGKWRRKNSGSSTYLRNSRLSPSPYYRFSNWRYWRNV